jgi:hypothetical protein
MPIRSPAIIWPKIPCVGFLKEKLELVKILLVNPPNCGRSIPEEQYGIDSLKQIFRGEPLALEVLAGNLETHDVRIVDLKAEPSVFQDVLSEFRPDIRRDYRSDL